MDERNFERGFKKKITCLTSDDETDPQPKDFKLDHMQMVPKKYWFLECCPRPRNVWQSIFEKQINIDIRTIHLVIQNIPIPRSTMGNGAKNAMMEDLTIERNQMSVKGGN